PHRLVFLFPSSSATRALHSFPTRRSSDLLELHASLLERLAGRGRRADAHVLGLDPRHRPRHQPAEGLEAVRRGEILAREHGGRRDRKSTRLNSSHLVISYAVFCLKKKGPA